MENRNYEENNEDVIDLKELMRFILRKWRILLLAGVIGVVLGAGVGLLNSEKTMEDLDMEEIHIKEIDQYIRYQQLYDEQLQKESDSVYMNMDPETVYRGSRIYYITASDSVMPRMNEMYNSIFRSDRIYYDLIEASGLECTETAIRDLAWLSFSKHELDENMICFGEHDRSASVRIETVAPTEEACRGMLNLLDERVQAINRFMEETYPNAKCELISDSCSVGYDSGVIDKRSQSAELLETYVEKISALKEKLTEDDLVYYREVYGIAGEKGLGWLKWGIIVGVLLGGMMVVFYGAKFLVDGHVKTVDELKLRYGLPLIALMAAAKSGKKSCMIDRLLETRFEYNTDAYLRAAMDMMKSHRIQICGDMKNAEIAAKLNLFSGAADIVVCDRFAVDEQAQRAVRDTDGAVLFVQLWKTKHAELLREIETCDRLGQKVLGVVVIG